MINELVITNNNIRLTLFKVAVVWLIRLDFLYLFAQKNAEIFGVFFVTEMLTLFVQYCIIN